MSADPIHILVYEAIPYNEHEVMFANSQLQEKDQTYKNIRPKDIEDVKKYKLQDGKTFLYEHNDDMVEVKINADGRSSLHISRSTTEVHIQ